MSSASILGGVVATVVTFNEGLVDARAALEAKLSDLGAIVKSRFSKAVTHIIFRRRSQPSPEQKIEEDEELRKLLSLAVKVM
jgi:protein tyrosine/serine phosphatase